MIWVVQMGNTGMGVSFPLRKKMAPIVSVWSYDMYHTGQCKRTGGCYNELVVAFLRTGGGLKGKKIYTCWLYDLFISLHLFY